MAIAKIKISEDELVKLFIKSNVDIKATGFQGKLVEQLETLAGIPDIVSVPKKQFKQIKKDLSNFPAKIFTNGYATVISNLSHSAYTEKQKLFELTGLSQSHMKKVLLELENLKIIEQNTKKSFRLNKNFKLPKLEIWSMEFKLNDWRCAFRQSLRHRNFSSYAMVVMPYKKKEILNKNKILFKKFNIGAAVYNNFSNHLEFIIKPKKCGAISKKTHIDTIGRMMMINDKASKI